MLVTLTSNVKFVNRKKAIVFLICLVIKKKTTPFMTIHSDVWGLARILTLSGACYFVTFIDECTCITWIALLQNKGDVCYVFWDFHHMVASQYKPQIQVL